MKHPVGTRVRLPANERAGWPADFGTITTVWDQERYYTVTLDETSPSREDGPLLDLHEDSVELLGEKQLSLSVTHEELQCLKNSVNACKRLSILAPIGESLIKKLDELLAKENT